MSSHGLYYGGISLRPLDGHDGIYQGGGDLVCCDFVRFTYLPNVNHSPAPTRVSVGLV